MAEYHHSLALGLPKFRSRHMFGLIIAFVSNVAAFGMEQPAAKVDFSKEMKPILAEHCWSCHGPDKSARKSKLRLDLREEAVALNAIIPGDPDGSDIFERIESEDPEVRMPPPHPKKSLNDRQKLLLRDWVAQGAEYRSHWAFVPTTRPELPKLKNHNGIRSPLDLCVRSELERLGLGPSPEADQATLLLRVTLDRTIASDFHRNQGRNTDGRSIAEAYRVEYVADRVHATATVFLGLSLRCARCHDYKYDPCTQYDIWNKGGRVVTHVIHEWPGNALKVTTKETNGSKNWNHVTITYNGTRKSSGLQIDYAANCLLARRLVERGVRFVQLYHRGWDNHVGLPTNIPKQCKSIDQSQAALVLDLKNRGLLDETLVVWGGGFGRTVCGQGGNLDDYGRDHHHGRCFRMCMAGGGIKPGLVHGSTDDYGYNIKPDPVLIHYLNARHLHCPGIDHERLTYPYQGRDFRLTDVRGRVIMSLLA